MSKKYDNVSAGYPWLKAYPANVDWFAKFTPMPLPALLDKAVENFSSHCATNFLGQTMSYKQLARRVAQATKGLQQLGVKPGIRVGLLLPNCPSFVIYYYAILRAGGTVVNLNPLYSEDELTHHAQDSNIEIIVTLDLIAIFPKPKILLEKQAIKKLVIVQFRHMLPFW